MKIEKERSLNKYLSELTDKLNSKQIPVKHKDREGSYRQFLRNEIQIVKSTLEREKENIQK